MKIRATLVFFSLFLLSSFAWGQDIYVFREKTTFKNPSWIVSSSEITMKHKPIYKGNPTELVRIRVQSDKPFSEILEELQQMETVIWAEEVMEYQTFSSPDEILATPNDPDRTSLQPWLETVNAYSAWDIGTGSSEVVIAIIDTGSEQNHEDLKANLWTNSGEIAGNGIDDDNNGFIDDVNGWDFFEKNGNSNPKGSSNNHGTHVAGLASAVTNNAKGIASISYNTQFMPIKISDNNGKNLSYGVESIIYAVDNGAKVINCSWGSTRFSKALETAVNYAWDNGVILTAAAGNDGTGSTYYPAGYPKVIAVGSVSFRNLVKSPYSNYGGFVDVVAPGGEPTEGIYSTLINNSYGASFGTSMASPIVASLAGLIRSIRTNWDVSTVRSQLETGAQSVTSANASLPYFLGSGIIKADASLSETLRPLAKLQNYHFGDPTNVSTVFNRGQEFSLYLNFLNLGIAQNAIKVSIYSLNDYFQVISGNEQTYSASHNADFTANPIQLRIRDDVSVNSIGIIRIELTYADNSKSNETVQINLVPDLITHMLNSIELSVNGTGRIGMLNYPSTSQGSGFIVKQAGTTQSAMMNIPLLREGGLVFGESESRISSAVRGAGSTINDEFYLIDYFESEFDAAKAVEKGKAVFTDLNAGIEGVRYDIVTTLETFAQADEQDANYILLKYTLKNESTSSYSKIRAGIYLDFDMPFGDPNNDISLYDVKNDFIAQFSGGTESDTTLYVGASIVEGIYCPWLINNNETDGASFFGVKTNSGGNGFTDEEKWRSMDFINASAAVFAGRRRIGPTNTSFMLSADAFSLEPQEEQSFTLILAYGIGFDQLTSTITRAKSRATLVTSNENSNFSELPQQFSFIGNYPNPFNPTSNLVFEIPESGTVKFDVFDMMGRQLSSSENLTYSAGKHTFNINATTWASGTYLVQMKFNNQIQQRLVTLIK